MSLDIMLKTVPPIIYFLTCLVQYKVIKMHVRRRRDAEDQIKFISREFQRSSVDLHKANDEVKRLRSLLMSQQGAGAN